MISLQSGVKRKISFTSKIKPIDEESVKDGVEMKWHKFVGEEVMIDDCPGEKVWDYEYQCNKHFQHCQLSE